MERITVNPDQCGGRPCVHGMRIRVSDVLDLLASGLTSAEIVVELLRRDSQFHRMDSGRKACAFARRNRFSVVTRAISLSASCVRKA